MSYSNLSADSIATITEFFHAVDKDSNGFVTITEVRDAMQVDTNSDGTISQAEIDASAKPWLDIKLDQDLDGNDMISLSELLTYNDTH
jgi:Ca2+-binding EF-hand superfamily protein